MARLIGFAQSLESIQPTEDCARSHAIRSAVTQAITGLLRSRNPEQQHSERPRTDRNGNANENSIGALHMQRLLIPLFGALTIVCWNAAATAEAQESALKLGGSGSTLGTIQLLAKAFEQANPGISVTVLSSLGSSGGIKAAIAGAIDIGLSARLPTDDERRQGAVAIEYGRSPLVFAVPRSLGVTAITTAQLVDIYAGKLNQWPDGTPIRLTLRPPTEITTLMLKSISPQMRDAVTAAGKRPGMLFALTEQEATENIGKIPGSLGPVTLCELITANPHLRALALDGIAPSAATIADRSYPYYLTFYLVTDNKPSVLEERFIAFVRSEAGKKILTDNGHWVPDQTGSR